MAKFEILIATNGLIIFAGDRDEVRHPGNWATHARRERSGVSQAAQEKQVRRCEMIMSQPTATNTVPVQSTLLMTLCLQGRRGEADGWCGGVGGGHLLWSQGLQGGSLQFRSSIYINICHFQTIGDQLPMMSFDEFYIHTNRAEINKAQAITRWLKMD